MTKLPQQSLAPTSHRFFSQRLRLHFVEWGHRDAPTVVLVHGVRDHSRTWDDLIADGSAARRPNRNSSPRTFEVSVRPLHPVYLVVRCLHEK